MTTRWASGLQIHTLQGQGSHWLHPTQREERVQATLHRHEEASQGQRSRFQPSHVCRSCFFPVAHLPRRVESEAAPMCPMAFLHPGPQPRPLWLGTGHLLLQGAVGWIFPARLNFPEARRCVTKQRALSQAQCLTAKGLPSLTSHLVLTQAPWTLKIPKASCNTVSS